LKLGFREAEKGRGGKREGASGVSKEKGIKGFDRGGKYSLRERDDSIVCFII